MTEDAPEFNVEMCRSVFADMAERCRQARAAGGIAHRDVVFSKEKPPAGYWRDWRTEYWLPPGFQFINPDGIPFQ